MTIALRPMRVADVALLERWDRDPDVAAAIGGPGAEWYDWPVELSRAVAWRELLIAVETRDRTASRPVGFVQLLDAVDDESHYWGDVEPRTWSLDIWIGDRADRGRGLGTRIMQAAIERVFDHHGAESIVIDPLVTNERAISFYRRLGFSPVGERDIDGDRCLVMRLDRTS